MVRAMFVNPRSRSTSTSHDGPKHKRLEVMIVVGRPVESARVRRTEPFGTSYAIYTDLLTADDVDDWIHELIFEAYDLNPAEAS
ncbi:MAG: hypothetical protein ACI9MX_000268 [Candidatus Aldehydirespiratoraceae bacterium]|jgi:hypothetical protein